MTGSEHSGDRTTSAIVFDCWDPKQGNHQLVRPQTYRNPEYDSEAAPRNAVKFHYAGQDELDSEEPVDAAGPNYFLEGGSSHTYSYEQVLFPLDELEAAGTLNHSIAMPFRQLGAVSIFRSPVNNQFYPVMPDDEVIGRH